MSDLIKTHGLELDRCAFCHDQCMSATPEVVATGDQTLVVSRVANFIRLADQGRLDWTEGLAKRLFYGLNDGLQYEYCLVKKEGHRIEPFLRAARAEAVRRGLAPAAVAAAAARVRDTGNVFGCLETLPEPVAPSRGGPILVHDAASRALTPDALAAARLLLQDVGDGPGELAIASCGMVEFDLGYVDLSQAAARRVQTALAALPEGPVVTGDPVLAYALRVMYPQWGLPLNRQVLHLSEYLVDRTDLLPTFRPRNEVATFHDPAALSRGLGIVDAPRALLARVSGLTLVEPVSSGAAAGSDGPLAGYPDPAVASAIRHARFNELVSTGASLIITSSPYSKANLEAADGGTPVFDLIEFLQSAR